MGLGLITASFCIVRTVLNFENVNQDPTWESVPNWYYRSWEVNIGMIAASIPALYPGFKLLHSTVHSFVSARKSQRTGTQSTSHKRLHDSNVDSTGKIADDFAEKAHLASKLTYPVMGREEEALRVTKHTTSVEGGRMALGGTEERNLRGDVEIGDRGIKKTTEFDVEGARSDSERSGEEAPEREERIGEEAYGFV
ncbi:MAG: hypothetical protein M1822_004921 [Bathelium mastoideum]|nr:MAG: hypothetical protein M1822_004921 [Bathelium mastoideum]